MNEKYYLGWKEWLIIILLIVVLIIGFACIDGMYAGETYTYNTDIQNLTWNVTGNTSKSINESNLLNRNSVIIANGAGFFQGYSNFDIGVSSGNLVDMYEDRFFGRGYYKRNRANKE